MLFQHTIMIVEDDDIILDIFNRIFNKEFNVILCRSVECYEKCLKENKVDLFILDMALGSNKTGLDLIKELRASKDYKKTPIVVVTAHAYIKDERLAINAGADRYYRKPIENKLLLDEIRKILSDNYLDLRETRRLKFSQTQDYYILE